MSQIPIVCKYGYYDGSENIRSRILCKKTNGGICGNVRFCHLSGRFEQSRMAADCPLAKEEEEELKDDSIRDQNGNDTVKRRRTNRKQHNA